MAFRYSLNQIPYDYTVKAINIFKGSKLVKKVPEKLWTEVPNLIKEAVIKSSSKKNASKKMAV